MQAKIGKIDQYILDLVGNAIRIQGAWDASTNDPDITSTTVVGSAWIVSVDGNTDLGGITDWLVGDMAVKTSTGWIKVDNTEPDLTPYTKNADLPTVVPANETDPLSLHLEQTAGSEQVITGSTPKLDVLKSKTILGTDANGKMIEGTHQDLSGYVPYNGATEDVNILEHDLNVGGVETLADFSDGATFTNYLSTNILVLDPYKVVPDLVPVFDFDYNSPYYLTFTDGALEGESYRIVRTIQAFLAPGYNLLTLDGYSSGATSGDGFVVEYEHHQDITVLGDVSATNVSGTNTGDRNNRQITVFIDGAGSAPTADTKTYVRVPYSGTITGWYIAGDVSGSCVIDVWKDTLGNFPPTVADTIAGTEKPTLSAAQTASDTSLTTWTTSVTAGDWIGINVDSASTLTKIWLAINVEASS